MQCNGMQCNIPKELWQPKELLESKITKSANDTISTKNNEVE